MQQSTKILRPKPGVRALCIVIYLVGIVLLAIRIPDGFKIIAVVVYALGGALWLADMFLKRIVLQADGIFIFSDFRSRTVSRAEIDSVTWEKGGGTSIKLRDGKWVRLPNAGQTSQGLANTIRAWLRRTEVET